MTARLLKIRRTGIGRYKVTLPPLQTLKLQLNSLYGKFSQPTKGIRFMSNLQVAVAQFAENIRKMVVDEILGSFGGASAHAAPKRLGRPLGSKNGVSRATKAEASIPVSEWNDLPSVKKPRKKPPVQYCPVPRCHNVAAPAFGMVCGKHKDLPKGEIRKYREARAEKRALEAGKVKKTAKKTKAKKTK